MEIVHIDNLPEWRKNNPDVKTVMVDHGPYGKVVYTFNHTDPQNIPLGHTMGSAISISSMTKEHIISV